MFGFDLVTSSTQDWWHNLNISLKLSKVDCDKISEHMLPVVIVVCMAVVLCQGMHRSLQKKDPRMLFHTLLCTLAIGVTAMPLCSLTRPLERKGFWGSKRVFEQIWRTYLLPYRLNNGYGLFRRMTGVGPSNGVGWAGQPPSVVARPEIVLEGVFEGDEEDTWTELSFRWKPGNVTEMPRQVAPHQPRYAPLKRMLVIHQSSFFAHTQLFLLTTQRRLDWQMWFAALGNPQSNVWFLNLLKKLLDDCGPVQHLVGDPALNSGRKLIKIRAKLFQYDFTRLNSEWSRSIPDVGLINSTDWTRDILRRPNQYWNRRFVRMYVAEVTKDHPGLVKQLTAYDYTSFCEDNNHDLCQASPNPWCHLASRIRVYNLHLIPIFLLFMYLLRGAKRSARYFIFPRRKVSVSQAKKNQ